MMLRRLALMLLLAVTVVLTVVAETYPAQYRVNTTLNVREGAGTWYGKVGRLHRGCSARWSSRILPPASRSIYNIVRWKC